MSQFDMENGKTLHRWTDPQGQEWACTEYDHGPFCRRCQPADELLHDLLDGVEQGDFVCQQDPDTGEFRFKATAQGQAKAEDLIASDPEAAALYARAQHGSPRPNLNPVEEGVLRALYEARETSPAELVEATGYTLGQVESALATLESLGFVG